MEENTNPLLSFKPEAPSQDKTVGQTLGDMVRAKYPATPSSTGGALKPKMVGSAFDSPVAGIIPNSDRPKVAFKDYVVPVTDIYAKLGDGTYQAKVKNYIAGTNNYERLAQEQTTGEKWANGLKKLGLKTGTAVLGGTVGSVVGLVNAISEGSLSALYTDDFNTMLDHYNEKLEYTLPNLVTEQERNMGVIQSMGTANFWANDVLGGLSFTLGAIVSEGIWGLATGGTSLIARGALGGLGRWSTKALGANKALAALNKFKSPTKGVINKTTLNVPQLGTGSVLAKGGEELLGAAAINKGATRMGAMIPNALNQARFIYTSAGYESGVEARHYLKEVEEEWLHSFEENNGRRPNAQELAEFKVGLESSGNAVWAANLALVGSSNMAIFGKMLLGKSTKAAASNSEIKRYLFGTGYNMEKGVATAIKATGRQKIAGKAYSILRAPVIEGVYEEGGQSVASKSVKDYVLSGYDAEATQDNLSMIDSLIQGFKQTYGTTQGQKEVAIGMIIGLFGGGIATGGRFNEMSKERENIENLTKFRNEFTPERILASQIAATRMMTNNRIIKANEKAKYARERGDLTGEFLSEQQAILASVERDAALQGTKQGIADFEAYLNTVPDADLAEQLGIEESEVAEWKSTRLEDYKNLSQKYQDNEKYVRALVGDQNFAGTSELNSSSEQIIKAITFNITLGEQSKEFTKKIVEDIKTTISGQFSFDDATTALNIDMALADASSKSIDKYMSLSQKSKDLEAQKAKLESELLSAQYNKGAQTEASVHAARLGKIQQRILDIDAQINEVRQNKETAFRALGIQNDLITLEDIDAQAERVQELKDVVEGYKNSNPALYTTLTKLFDEYNKAKSNTVNFQNLTKELLDPKIRVDVINGWMSGIVKKNKSLDDSTKEFFRGQLEQYEKNQVQGKVSSGQAMDKTQTDSPEEEETLMLTEGDEMTAPPVEAATPMTRRSPLEALKAKIEDIMNKNTYITSYIGDNFDEAVKNKPSKEDVDRYEELLGKINTAYITKFTQLMTAPKGWFKSNGIDTGLSVEELEELKDLQRKLSNWKVLEGSTDEGDNSIADLLLLVEQLETEVEKANTKRDITPNEFATMKQAPDREAKEGFETSEGVQSPDQALVSLIDIKGEATYSFSHLDVRSLTRLFPESTLEYVKGKTTKPISELTKGRLARLVKQEGSEFILNTPQGAIKVKVGKRARLNISKKSLDNSINSSNIAIVKYGSGNFMDVYEKLSNGDLIPLRGDFSYASELKGEVIELVPEVVNNVSEGQILITRINRNDSYNKALISAYNKGQKTEEDFTELMNDLHIYITDQTGKVVGSLRAAKSDLPNNETTKNLLELRRKAVNMILDEKITDDYFSLNESIPVRTVLIGSPNLVIGEDLKPKSIDFTDTALEKVVDVGYFQGDVLRLRNMNDGKVVKTFLPKSSSTKMPVVIIKVNGKDVAFPVTLKSTMVDKSARIQEILSTDLRMTDKITRINAILIENGFKPSNYVTDTQGRIGIDVEKVLKDLASIEDFPNLADWLKSNYKLERIQSEAQISVDLDNNPFNLSKIMLDLSKTKTIGRVDQIRMKYDNVEDREIQLREDIQGAVAPILAGMNLYPDVDDVRWTNVLFAENELYRNPKTDVERRHNVNLLRDALYKDGKRVAPPKAVRVAYGDKFIEKLRTDLEELDRITKLKNTTRADIKNAIVKQQKQNQNTAC